MPVVQGLLLSPQAAPPARRTFSALFTLLFLSPIFYLVWGVLFSGVGYYFVGGSFIFILVAIGDIKKKIAMNDRQGIRCCSVIFLLLGILCSMLALAFLLRLFGACSLACTLGHSETDTQPNRVVYPFFVALAVAFCELSIFRGLQQLAHMSRWSPREAARIEPRGIDLGSLPGNATTSSRVRDLPGSQWVSSVTVSSEAGGSPTGRHQCVGRPRIYPRYGPAAAYDIDELWAALRGFEGGAEETYVLEFTEAVRVGAIEVYETFMPGAVTSVELRDASGQWWTAWRGNSERGTLPGRSRVFSPPLEMLSFETRHVRLVLDRRGEGGRSELDAVRILRHDQPMNAIATATAIPSATLVTATAMVDGEGGEGGEASTAHAGGEMTGSSTEVLQAVVVHATPAMPTTDDPTPAATDDGGRDAGPVQGVALPADAAVAAGWGRGGGGQQVPPLVVLVDLFRTQLGVDGTSMDQVVANAATELGVDTAGQSLMQQAVTCWRVLGSPTLNVLHTA